jgi:antitoxin (DNA-binding transcriptional repressor) of toxin-antitoxin stability system
MAQLEGPFFVNIISGSAVKPPKTITSVEFECRCSELIELVRRARQPLLITRRGKPVAQLSPYLPGKTRGKKAMRAKPLNPLEDSILYEGDLISPIDTDWEAMP